MISRNLYLQIVFRVVFIVFPSVVAGWLIASNQSLLLILLCISLIIAVVINLINYLNSTNRKISYFLESVQNEDSTLSFPINITDKPILEIHQGLNKVNKQIQQLKIESRQQEQYFETLLEHVAIGIVTFNNNGFVLNANSAAKKMLGADVLTHINQLEIVNRNLFQVIRDIQPFEQKLVSLATDLGVRELSIKASPFKIQNDGLILLAIQDIRSELDERELDSWMKLIRVLMHEIMNSIAPITSIAESLSELFTIEKRPVIPEEMNENTIKKTIKGLNVIREQGSGMISFVESYRKLARLPVPNLALFMVDDLFDRIRIIYFSLENKGQVQLSTSVNPPELEIMADENLISQVLLNLIKNALEAIGNDPNGKIKMVGRFDRAMKVEICVIDNGPGIQNEIVEQIFVPFFTTREKGSGIGLSLSRQIMRLHGGSLQVRSIPDKETVFSMTF